MKAMLVCGLVLHVATAAALLCACGADLKEKEAEAAYLGKQLACVDKAKARDEADACRRAVRAEFGIAETAHDAGGQ